MNITEKQRLVEWLNERLGLIYMSLYQLPESPGTWEVIYEDEIEPLETIRALIESGAKRGDNGFIAHIQAHLGAGEKVICKICGKTAEEIIHEISQASRHC